MFSSSLRASSSAIFSVAAAASKVFPDSFNRVILVGNVGKNPEFRSFEGKMPPTPTAPMNGKPPVSTNPYANKKPETQIEELRDRGLWTFSVATTRNFKKSDGEWVKETEWHRIKDFSNSKKWMYVCGAAGKGALVMVEGRLKHRVDEESGRTYTDIIAEKVEVLRNSSVMESIDRPFM
ncbi:hypothetical protein BJ741DRAFT_601550 [Chytriomyces cf. hyalinus JEL632]|nr:hypothetical protein BJ741DRAFT_601550 [Chytriomyces cf. hyalinus JEL632]